MKPDNPNRVYCGWVLMQSDWYRRRVADGPIDRNEGLIMVFSEAEQRKLEAQGHTNIYYSPPRVKPPRRAIWRRLHNWLKRGFRHNIS